MKFQIHPPTNSQFNLWGMKHMYFQHGVDGERWLAFSSVEMMQNDYSIHFLFWVENSECLADWLSSKLDNSTFLETDFQEFVLLREISQILHPKETPGMATGIPPNPKPETASHHQVAATAPPFVPRLWVQHPPRRHVDVHGWRSPENLRVRNTRQEPPGTEGSFFF